MNREEASLSIEGPWRFSMVRARDGRHATEVADGVMFRDRRCVLRWRSENASTAAYDSFAALERVHGHDGTSFVWHDQRPTDAFSRAVTDCIQDSCENCPFASIGGLTQRHDPKVPHYIAAEDAAEWTRGYTTAAHAMYGDDWRTCEFGWSLAVTIEASP